MASGPLTVDQVSEYHDKGYTLARGMFDREEIGLLRRSAKEDRDLDAHSFGRDDGEGKVVASLYGIIRGTPFTACSRGANRSCVSAEKLLGGEVYHYHSKMIMKDAKVGGRLGLASGLWLLVSERRPVPASLQRIYCRRSGDQRKRLPAGGAGVARHRAHRSRDDGRSSRRGPGAGASDSGADAADLR